MGLLKKEKLCFENVDTNVCMKSTDKLINKSGKLFAKAFKNYPLFQKTLPDEEKREERLETLPETMTCYALDNGNVYTTENF